MLKKLFVLLLVVQAPFSLRGFDKVTDWVGLKGGAWLTEVKINADPKMNSLQNKVEPCKLAIVFSKNDDPDFKTKLMGYNGPAFFGALEQIKKDHGNDLYIITTDVLPTDQRTISVEPKDNPAQEEIYHSAKFVVGYVSYQTPGDHRFSILSGPGTVTLNFGPDGVTVVAEQKK